jgi:hypothetical protein
MATFLRVVRTAVGGCVREGHNSARAPRLWTHSTRAPRLWTHSTRTPRLWTHSTCAPRLWAHSTGAASSAPPLGTGPAQRLGVNRPRSSSLNRDRDPTGLPKPVAEGGQRSPSLRDLNSLTHARRRSRADRGGMNGSRQDERIAAGWRNRGRITDGSRLVPRPSPVVECPRLTCRLS